MGAGRVLEGPFAVTPQPWGKADCRHALSEAEMGAGLGSAGPHSKHTHLTEGDLLVLLVPP